MLHKYYSVLIVLMLLVGCTTERNQTPESQELSQSAQVAKSEIVVPNSESYGTVEVIGGDEQTLRDFIQRWFTPVYTSPSSLSGDTTTITIGGLPEDFVIEFPLPEQGIVFASVETPYDVQIMLDVPMNSEDLMAAYTQNLEAASWMLMPENVKGGGFVSATDNWHVYCDDQSKVALILQSYPKSTQETELRISVYDKDTQYMCDPQGSGYVDQDSLMLPVLKTPTGALVTGGGSSSGGGAAESSSDIRTDLTPRELNTHFSSQMETAKWNRLDSGDVDKFSWSSWEITDDRGDLWNGTLIILKNPVEEDLLYAMIRVRKESR